MKKPGSHTDFSFSFSSLPYWAGRGANHGPLGLTVRQQTSEDWYDSDRSRATMTHGTRASQEPAPRWVTTSQQPSIRNNSLRPKKRSPPQRHIWLGDRRFPTPLEGSS